MSRRKLKGELRGEVLAVLHPPAIRTLARPPYPASSSRQPTLWSLRNLCYFHTIMSAEDKEKPHARTIEGIDPRLKGFIDRVIVPALVDEWHKEHRAPIAPGIRLT